MKNNFLKKVFTISSFLLLGTLTACNTLQQNNDSEYHEVYKRSDEYRDMKLSKQLNNNSINNDINTKDKHIALYDDYIEFRYLVSYIEYISYALQETYYLYYESYLSFNYDYDDNVFYDVNLSYSISVNGNYGSVTNTGFYTLPIDLSEILLQGKYFEISTYVNVGEYFYEYDIEVELGASDVVGDGYEYYYLYTPTSSSLRLGQFNEIRFTDYIDANPIYEDLHTIYDYASQKYDNGYDSGYEEGYEQAITDNAKDTGIFKYGNITLGLYDIDEEEFDTDYSYEGDINTGIVDSIEGGFIMNEIIYDFEESYIVNNLASDYSIGYMVDFGELGVDINDVQYLFPLQGQGGSYIPRLDYGVQYKFTFENGVVSFNGADEGPMSSFNVFQYFNGLGRLKNILALGNNYDYVPYGITQNLSYSFGYDSGYAEGRSEGFDSGYDSGYINGANATASQKYTEGYNKGYLDGINSIEVNGITFESLAHAIITAPSTMIKNAFDFDILGVNVGGLVNTALVIALVVFAIGLFKKG